MKANILSATLMAAAMLLSSGASAQKTQSLFNGKDLSNWKLVLEDNSGSPEQTFSVKDGNIFITGTPRGYMYTTETFGNCKVHAEWRWPNVKASDSGIFVLLTDPKARPSAVQCNLKADDAGSIVSIGVKLAEYKTDPKDTRPVEIFSKYQKSSEKPVGEWNEANIFIINGVMSMYINGVLQNIGTCTKKEGAIGLQSEGGEIEFRNVTVTPIE